MCSFHAFFVKPLIPLYLLLSYYPYFGKIKVGICDRHAVCVCIPYSLFNYGSTFMKLSMHIMVPEPISTAYFIITYHQSVCMCPPYRC
jgi:hypothetical protein